MSWVTVWAKLTPCSILAVIPCNIDAATQEILKFASEADPKGNRTMGVLTKPDLVTEAATRETVMELLHGRRSKLKLGYFVVKNRTADDSTSSAHQRTAAETAIFAGDPWADATGRCGTSRQKYKTSCEVTSRTWR